MMHTWPLLQSRQQHIHVVEASLLKLHSSRFLSQLSAYRLFCEKMGVQPLKPRLKLMEKRRIVMD